MLYSYAEFAKLINKSTQTLKEWNKKGKLKPKVIHEDGNEYYTEEQLLEVINPQALLSKKIIIAYTSVVPENADFLNTKLKFLKQYTNNISPDHKLLSDIRNNSSLKEPGISEVIQLLASNKVHTLILFDENELVNKELLPFFKKLIQAKETKIIIIKKGE